MQKKFAIEYILFPHHNERAMTHHTDDPVEVEDFLMHLLVSGAHISAIRHEAVELTSHQFDHKIKIATERLMVKLLSESLGLDGAEIRHRFGFAA